MTSAFSNTFFGPANWQALAAFPHLLVRRSADRDEWVIAVREGSGQELDQPEEAGAWAGHVSFDHDDVLDKVGTRFEAGPMSGSRWWRPDTLLVLRSGRAEPIMGNADHLLLGLRSPQAGIGPIAAGAVWERRTSKAHYLATVRGLLEHIQHGDIYEVNYCTERSTVLSHFDPFHAFERLIARTDAPYAALYRRGDLFALCLSPEHFLRVENGGVMTRPMKGTRRRSTAADADAALGLGLANDPKERSENIMAVDVARNDLSRIARAGSVRVDELCGVRSYPNVHQLVSTVRAGLRSDLRPWDAVRAAFPMASMTGAPKRRALQLIDEAEEMPRGLFSGSLGYQLPDGTLDLNVVIRTIMYDASTGKASLITGSAITAMSDPEQEWEECELKARSVLNALGHA